MAPVAFLLHKVSKCSRNQVGAMVSFFKRRLLCANLDCISVLHSHLLYLEGNGSISEV
jgi:hypothetical protein